MFDVDLINAVRRYPCIYDTNMDRTRLIVKMAWKVISGEVGESEVCRNRWKSIRDRFVKEHKSTGLHQITPWPLRDHMEFLKEFIVSYKPTTREDASHNISSYIHTEEKTEENIVCADDKCTNQDLNFIFGDIYTENDVDEPKEEYSVQIREEKGNATNISFKFDYQDNNGDCANSSMNEMELCTTSKKRTFNDPQENSMKKKRKLFLNDLIDPQKNVSLQTLQLNEDPLTKYDTLLGTLNDYITNRIKEEQDDNEDFFKVLDTYLIKLPENVQDELMAKILIKVLNKNNE